jgi:hypothetical protein
MISQAVEDRLIRKVEALTDVTVHIDPEDDEDAPACRGLPLRVEVLQALDTAWRDVEALPAQREVRLHYLSGRIEVEVVLPLRSLTENPDTMALQSALEAAAADLPWFGPLRILYG